jgi:protein TIF31
MNSVGSHSGTHGSNVFEERIGDMNITVKKDGADASLKVEDKVDGVAFCQTGAMDIAQRNLLKGLTSDENVVAKVMPCTFHFYPISFHGIKIKSQYL